MAQVFTDTREAALAACQFVAGRLPFAGSEAQQVEQLNSHELQPFTLSVRMFVSEHRDTHGTTRRCATLWANDAGCVNNGPFPLATCWLDENGRFYYEA